MNLLPTRNRTLALHRAVFRSVPEMLDYAAKGETGVTFFNAKGELLSTLPWREMRDRAHVAARKLIGAGFAPGERLLITADTWPGFFDAFFGAQYAGLLPVPISIPVGIGGKLSYLDQLRRQRRHDEADQAHVVVKRQPAHGAVAFDDVEAGRSHHAGQVGH